jgi:hypothetical protein
MSPSRVAATIVGALTIVAATGVATAAATPVARPSARLAITFAKDAVPGRATALHVRLRIDLRRQPSPVTQVNLRYPASLGITTSGLGVDQCIRPQRDFEAVVIKLTGRLDCPQNAVMALGKATGEIRFDDRRVSREVGAVTVLAGGLDRGRLRLVTLIEGINPIGARLAYSGEVGSAPKPYGGDLTFRIRQIPPRWNATIALSDLDVAFGSPRIVYNAVTGGESVRYRPEGVLLPRLCPGSGFPFSGKLAFADGSEAALRATAPCPIEESSARGPRSR